MSVGFARSRSPKEGPPPPPPSSEKGVSEPYRWCLRLPGQFEEYAYASTEVELASVLLGLPEYAYLDAQSALVERIRFAIGTQCWQQARLNVIAQSVTGDWSTVEQWQRDVLGGSRASQPHDWPPKTADGVDLWDCCVPLVLVTTGYEPYSDIAAPVGELVWWIDPIENATLLGSLEDYPLGLIDVHSVEDLD